MQDLWCPTGCQPMDVRVCRSCGYSGEGVPEEETRNVLDHDGGRWFLRERLKPLFFVTPAEEADERQIG